MYALLSQQLLGVHLCTSVVICLGWRKFKLSLSFYFRLNIHCCMLVLIRHTGVHLKCWNHFQSVRGHVTLALSFRRLRPTTPLDGTSMFEHLYI